MTSEPDLCPSCQIPIRREAVPLWTGDDQRVAPTRVPGRTANLSVRGKEVPKLDPGQWIGCAAGHRLPAEFFKYKQLRVGLLGPTQSMKSHFLAVILDALCEGPGIMLGQHTRVTGEPDPASEPEIYDQYLSFPRSRKVLNHTVPLESRENKIRSPLSILIEANSADPLRVGFRDRKPVHLLLWDAAGEDMRDLRSLQKAARYLAHAHAIILFVDPLQLSKVRRSINHDYHPLFEDLVFERRPLGTVIQMARQESNTDQALFVAITKADLLDHGVNELSAFSRVRELPPDAKQQFARKFVQNYASHLVDSIDKFDNVSYGFMSAAGCAPRAGNTSFAQYDPWGCTEALGEVIRMMRWPSRWS